MRQIYGNAENTILNTYKLLDQVVATASIICYEQVVKSGWIYIMIQLM